MVLHALRIHPTQPTALIGNSQTSRVGVAGPINHSTHSDNWPSVHYSHLECDAYIRGESNCAHVHAVQLDAVDQLGKCSADSEAVQEGGVGVGAVV